MNTHGDKQTSSTTPFQSNRTNPACTAAGDSSELLFEAVEILAGMGALQPVPGAKTAADAAGYARSLKSRIGMQARHLNSPARNLMARILEDFGGYLLLNLPEPEATAETPLACRLIKKLYGAKSSRDFRQCLLDIQSFCQSAD